MSAKYISNNWRLLNQENSSKNDNYGLTYDGSEYIDCGDSDIFSFGNGSSDFPFTVSAWVYAEGSSSFPVFDKYPDSGSWSLREYRMLEVNSSNQVFCTLYDSSKSARFDIYSDSLITRDQWQHLTITYDGRGGSSASDGVKIYINGVESTKTVNAYGTYVAMENKSTPVRIGRVGSAYADGTISQLSLFDYALTSTQISTLYGSSSLGSASPLALKPQPVAYYPLGDNSASNPLTQPNVAVEDATVFETDAGFIELEGGNLAPILNGISNFTLSLWYKQDAISNRFVFDIKDGTNRMALQLVNAATNYLYFNSSYNSYSAVDTPINQWNNLVFVFDGSQANADRIKLYINGSQITAATTGTIDSTLGSFGSSTVANLGAASTGGSLYALNGEITNSQIWNASLSSSEVTTLYNSGVPLYTGTQPQAANLKAWYKLNNTANWEADSSGNWQIPEATSAYPQSFDFDSTSDIINFSTIDLGTTHTISMWVKITATSFANIISGTGGSAIRLNAPNRIYYYTNNYTNTQPSISIPLNQWNNIVIVRETTTIKFYVNNSLLHTTTSFAGDDFSFNKILGLDVNNQTSNIQLWDSALPATGADSVETLYNNGSPLTTAIESSNLKAWYKLDNTATFSTNWSIPDASGNGNTGTSSGMTEQSLVNNNVSVLNGESSGMTSANLVTSDLTRAIPYGDGYSFNFDGIDDIIEVPRSTDLEPANITVSCWVNVAATGSHTSGYFVNKMHTSGSIVSYGIYKPATPTFLINVGGVIKYSPVYGTDIRGQGWTHLVGTYDGAYIRLYVNGTEVGTGTAETGSISYTTEKFNIGSFESALLEINGKISNVSIFDEALTSTEVLKLYANGVPQDLSSFTPQPVAWYPLGSNSFWNGSAWTCRDMIGSNDGTGQNIGVDGLVGSSPRSEANGTGTNMDVPSNLEGNTKWSSNNSYSVNMSSLARVEDVA